MPVHGGDHHVTEEEIKAQVRRPLNDTERDALAAWATNHKKKPAGPREDQPREDQAIVAIWGLNSDYTDQDLAADLAKIDYSPQKINCIMRA